MGHVEVEGLSLSALSLVDSEFLQPAHSHAPCLFAATKAWKKLVTDKAEVEGLPSSALALAAQQAAADAKKVPMLR